MICARMWLALCAPTGHYARVSGVFIASVLLLAIAYFASAAAIDEKTRGRKVMLGVAVSLWVLASLAIVISLAFEISNIGPSSPACPVAGSDSEYAPSHWSVFPPGEVCEYATGDEGPGYGRVVAVIGLLGFAVAAAFARSRRRGSEA